jgi:cellulose synthase/poly-beta-1,6-N-acetylglucosamine synthase-like glycosyltransferase
VSAVVIGAAYLIWRLLFTIAWDAWWVSIPLYLLELHAYLGLLLFIPSTWDLDANRPARRVTAPESRVAILLPTYNESVDILLPTIAAAIATRLPHETWVLDDGNRPAVKRLAEELGAIYVARAEHSHAKAGNINHVLPLLDVDFVAILDADHVAEPDLLEKTLGYFDDPDVALVQTPQDFYNVASFEHFGPLSEQQLFYRILQPARNRWNAAFWCGTGGIVRLSALRAVGGLATESITEDIHTTIRLHRAGWKTVYHNEPLARGLAAFTAEQYLAQRLRWGTGAMQVLRVDDPLFGPGLTIMQRISYAGTLFGWFDSWRTLGYVLVPLVVIFTGANPLSAPLMVLLPAFLLQFLVQQYALTRLSRGMAKPFWSIVFDFARLPATLAATLQRFSRQRLKFAVTDKGADAEGKRRRVPVPGLLFWLALFTVVAVLWGLINLLYPDPPLRYVSNDVVWGAMFWASFNGVFIVAASRRIHARRYASELRETVRFAVALPAHWNGRHATVRKSLHHWGSAHAACARRRHRHCGR